MSILKWQYDPETAHWTRKLTILDDIQPSSQFSGRLLNASIWEHYILASRYPEYCYDGWQLSCSPENIVRCFADGCVLEGLGLTVGWGKMERTKNKVYAR